MMVGDERGEMKKILKNGKEKENNDKERENNGKEWKEIKRVKKNEKKSE